MTSLVLSVIVFVLQVKPFPAEPANLQDRGSIEGYVIDAATHAAVPKCVVTLSPVKAGRSYTLTTGADGRFVFQNIDPGQYRLSAARDRYVRTDYGARAPGRTGSP